ncbi:MAG: response regulator [Phenylobacterium sp.]|nr:MAG: response regulator [Phenylobacterium sp.]
MQVEEMGHSVCGTAATADEAILLAQEHRPSVVLMDMRLRGEKDGVDAALAIYSTVRSRVIFVTGSKEQATIDRIELDHPAGMLFKPVSSHQLRSAIEFAITEGPWNDSAES